MKSGQRHEDCTDCGNRFKWEDGWGDHCGCINRNLQRKRRDPDDEGPFKAGE